MRLGKAKSERLGFVSLQLEAEPRLGTSPDRGFSYALLLILSQLRFGNETDFATKVTIFPASGKRSDAGSTPFSRGKRREAWGHDLSEKGHGLSCGTAANEKAPPFRVGLALLIDFTRALH